MHKDLQIPDLTFPEVEYGTTETPWDLKVLLYKGGAAANRKLVAQLIADQIFGDPRFDRLTLVIKLHEEINAGLRVGGSRETAFSQITHLRFFFGWADSTDHPLSMEAVSEAYCAWADLLVHRTRLRRTAGQTQRNPNLRFISMRSAYSYGATVGTVLNRVLGRHTNIIETTRLYMPSQRKTAVGVQAEKQSLAHTFAFGNLLQDICDALTIQTVMEGSLPVHITLRNGNVLLRGGGTCFASLNGTDVKMGERYPLANLRIEAELLMFIGQTAMNVAQAHKLELRHFFYVSHLDGYQVKDHKSRRGGTVLFEIFKDYKPHFERYLAWRRHLFPHSSRLFPFVRVKGARQDSRFQGERLRAICANEGTPFIGPQTLRNTRVNWMLRKSADPDLTAEMSQHTKQTLLGVYELPSLQRTMVEATRFWSKTDPLRARTQAVAPGGCSGRPQAVPEIPDEAPKPDCARASGCLWCENHRDVDSQNHVWALVSFKRLKVIELSKLRSPQRDEDVPPAQHTVDRLNEKLRWFERSNETRREWVIEAQARIDEGNYHPDWHHIIAQLEGTI